MKKADVKIGETYLATVSGRQVRVRIDRERTRQSYGNYAGPTRYLTYWQATNLTTGRSIEIKSAARLTRITSLALDNFQAARRRRCHEILRPIDAAGDRTK